VLENQDSLERSVERAVELIVHAHREGAPRAISRFRAASPRSAPAPGGFNNPEEALAAFLSVVDGLAEREPRVAAYMLGGMHGPHIDERRKKLFELAPDAVLAALHDLPDDVSFELRRRAGTQHPGITLRSLGLALRAPHGWELWQQLAELAPADALSGLTGLDDERAWEARQRFFQSQSSLRELAVGSLSGLASARAWAMRDDLLTERAGELDVSYELSRVVAKSVTGLGDERAWELRRKARKLAPVAALSSLMGVSDDESWRWRQESLHKAPKVVMSTLRGSLNDLAWQMRHAVAVDCKEALDGLQGVSVDAAWSLRDTSLDVWPSTVIKTLANLADEPRGKALIERQLRQYPANVSLLKHVACIALGLHQLDSSHASPSSPP
jgi:hypothetical protein